MLDEHRWVAQELKVPFDFFFPLWISTLEVTDGINSLYNEKLVHLLYSICFLSGIGSMSFSLLP